MVSSLCIRSAGITYTLTFNTLLGLGFHINGAHLLLKLVVIKLTALTAFYNKRNAVLSFIDT